MIQRADWLQLKGQTRIQGVDDWLRRAGYDYYDYQGQTIIACFPVYVNVYESKDYFFFNLLPMVCADHMVLESSSFLWPSWSGQLLAVCDRNV